MFNNKKLSEGAIYSVLSKTHDLTSYEINSLIHKAKSEHVKIKELTKTQKKQLENKINGIEKFIISEKVKIKKHITEIDKLKLKKTIDHSKISKLVSSNKKKQLVLVQKEIKLKRLKNKLLILNKRIDTNTFKLCFGSSQLMKQRPGHHCDKFRLNNNQKVYHKVEDWKFDWDLSRNNVWYIIGKSAKPQGNAEIQYYPNEKKLRLRLPENIALSRMQKLANQTKLDIINGKGNKISALRMSCKFLQIDNVEFNHRFFNYYLIALQNKQPITAKIVKKISSKHDIGYYLQLSFEEKYQLKDTKKEKQLLGIDLNEKGLAYTIVKADGNRLVIKDKAVNGFLQWDLHGKSENKRRNIISQTIEKVLLVAKGYDVVELAIENLDFSWRIAKINSGYKSNQKYNEMLTQFAKTQFKTLLTRKCDRLGLQVHLVNPSYSSVGGFIKYGLINKCPVDIAASHWLARQALFGEIYKKEHNVNYIKKYQEVMSLPCKIQLKQSKRLNEDELKCNNIALTLGKNRKLWISKSYELIKKLNVAQIKLNLENNPFQT
jgi:IS605 OrfB family transposase